MLLLIIETENHISHASLNQKYLIQENVLILKGQKDK